MLKQITQPLLKAAAMDRIKSSRMFFERCCTSHTTVRRLPLPRQVEVPHPKLIDALQRAMTYDLGGVHVLWLPSDAGKATALRRAAYDLQRQGTISSAIYIDNLHQRLNPMSRAAPLVALKAALHIQPPTTAAHASSLLGRILPSEARTVIIIDQFDQLVQESKMSLHHLAPFVSRLAESSVAHRNHRVVLGIQNAWLAREVLGWHSDKNPIFSIPEHRVRIWEDFAWTREQLQMLYQLYFVKRHPLMSRHSVYEKDRILQLATLSGRPGYLLRFIGQEGFGGPAAINVACAHEKEWRTGQTILNDR